MANHSDRPSMPSNDTSPAGVTWTGLADRVRAFTREFRLEIAFSFETSDPRAIAEQLGNLALRYIAQAPPNEAGQAARVAVQYAELARQGRRFAGTAVLTGGPRDPHARDDYHHGFGVLVHQAVKRVGLLLAEEEAFQVWSERLRREKHSLKLGTVEDAGEATALLCEHFSAIAEAEIRREFAFAPTASPPAPAAPTFADQLVAARTAKRMSTPELAADAKVNERTIRHYEAGERVPRHWNVIKALEKALATTFQLPERRAPRRRTKRSAKARKSP